MKTILRTNLLILAQFLFSVLIFKLKSPQIAGKFLLKKTVSKTAQARGQKRSCLPLERSSQSVQNFISDYSAILKNLYSCYFAQKENKLSIQRYFLCRNQAKWTNNDMF